MVGSEGRILMKAMAVGWVMTFSVALALEGADGGAGTFGRVDRNRDGLIDATEAPPALGRRMSQFDTNGDGKLDPKEFASVAERMRQAKGAGSGPGQKGSMRREGETNAPPAQAERHPDKLKVGDIAPDFTLPLAVGEGEITLSKFGDGKPVVLVFGSLTCPPFRERMLAFDPIYQKYRDRAAFLMVYTREAHPESTIYIRKGDEEILQKIEQTDRMDERMEHARVCGPTLKFTFPTVVDKVDNKVNAAYAGWPSRFVVVGADGKIAFDGGPGPRGFQPDELEKWLAEHPR